MEHLIGIDPIVRKYLCEETLSSEEQVALDLWISQGQGRSQMLESLKNDTDQTKTYLAQMEQVPNSRIWDILESRLQQDGHWREEEAKAIPLPYVVQPVARSFWRYIIAASVVLLAAGGAYWGLHRHTAAPAEIAAKPAQSTDFAPGANRAVLTLADGRKINLDSSANGVVASQGNMQVSKLADGQLVYQQSSEAKLESIAYNVLSTPRAGQFSLSLPDGSRVWLNNASSLRYPVAFTGATREVDLSGEAYFEVAKDPAHPFLVHTHDDSPAGPGTIEVLGTSFNIMAYSDENAERTTLVEGSIRHVHGSNSTLLKPEEQSVADTHGNLKTLRHVNVAEITAWKNGYFHFDHTNLETTMRQISRWYDIPVEYQGTIPPQEFMGKIQRNLPLSALLKGLEGENVHFRLEEKKLVVSQ